MWINENTQKVYTTHSDIRRDFPDVSMPSILNDSTIYSLNVKEVQLVPKPEFDKNTHDVLEALPIQVNEQWVQQWEIINLDQDTVASNLMAAAQALQANIVSSTQARLDNFFQTRNYDGVLSACTYATSTIPKFASEGQYAVNARDITWATLYTLMGEVQAGTRSMPSSFDDVIPLLPSLEWPV